jgi:hypothetical protein
MCASQSGWPARRCLCCWTSESAEGCSGDRLAGTEQPLRRSSDVDPGHGHDFSARRQARRDLDRPTRHVKSFRKVADQRIVRPAVDRRRGNTHAQRIAVAAGEFRLRGVWLEVDAQPDAGRRGSDDRRNQRAPSAVSICATAAIVSGEQPSARLFAITYAGMRRFRAVRASATRSPRNAGFSSWM